MRKLLLIALAILASASYNSIDAAKRKKKTAPQEQPVEVVAPVVLTTGSDSLSYAAGMMLTNGLIDYLVQQLKVDTACIADFVRGFNEAVTDNNDPHDVALKAGRKIGEQVKDGMLPRITSDFTNTPDTIVNELLFRGFTDAITADTTVMKTNDAQAFFNVKQEYNSRVKAERLSKPGRDFLAANAARAAADSIIITPSGLQYKILVQGNGQVPQRTDKVKVNYEGRLIDGTVFDASSKHGSDPATFQADQVIRGWTEALTMMPVGSKWRLFIPSELAYGERAVGQIPPYSTLIFDVELVGIEQ